MKKLQVKILVVTILLSCILIASIFQLFTFYSSFHIQTELEILPIESFNNNKLPTKAEEIPIKKTTNTKDDQQKTKQAKNQKESKKEERYIPHNYVNLNQTDSNGNFLPSLPWDLKWYESSELLNEPLHLSKSNCNLCNFKPTQIDPSSSQNDVIITVAMDRIYGLPTTIRSIRTAGIQSGIVILADTVAYKSIQKEMKDLIENCGVNVINIGTLDQYQMKGRYRTRWHLVYDYFRINPLNFTRFIMTDAYDSFFQGDAFLKTIKADSLYFSTESIIVGKCPHNSNWIREIYPKSLSKMKTEPIICAGPVAGGVAPLLKFCEIMFALDMWEEKWITPPDQAYVNYVVRTHMLENASIPYVVVPNDGFMTTVGYCDRKNPLTVDENGNIGCPGFKTTPMLLHQYVRPRNMRGHIFDVCNSTSEIAFKRDPYSKASF